MGDDITIGVTEIVNNIEVTAQPNDQIVDISVIDNTDEVTLNITPTVIEINVNKGSSYAKWGTILGTLSDQEDLQDALDLKANLVDGKVPASELPSYVDDIIEVANYAALPTTGEIGKIYVTLDNNKIYRWSGSIYIEIAANNAIWGAITGTLSNQLDLQAALDTKALKTITITPNAPLSGGGDLSSNRTLSITQANTTTDGYLSSTDWNTFNSKLSSLSGAVLTTTDQTVAGVKKFTDGLTSDKAYNQKIISGTFMPDAGYGNFFQNDRQITFVQFNSAATAVTQFSFIYPASNTNQFYYLPDASGTLALTSQLHNPVAISTTGTINGLSIDSSQILTIAVASSTQNGVLSSTDWTTFNNKQNALTNPITGSLTTNYLPKATGSTTLGNSLIYDNGTNVGIGTTSPSQKLSINGNAQVDEIFVGVTSSFLSGTTNAQIGWSGGFSGLTNGSLILQSRSNVATPIIFATETTEKMRINGNGNVGIGTTSPAAKLHIQDTNGGIFFDGSGATYNRFKSTTSSASVGRDLLFSTQNSGTTPDLYITSTGNVGIGTTSPYAKNDIFQDTTGYGGWKYALNLSGTDYPALRLLATTGNTGNIIAHEAGSLVFLSSTTSTSAGSEKMRITSGGDVLVGTTSAISSASNTSVGATFGKSYNWLAITDSNYIQRSNNTDGAFFNFFKGSTSVGSITVSGSTTLYNVTSDYRLKQDFKSFNGLDLVSKIKVYDHEWKADNSRMNGVIAHELQEVVPYAVTGEKDAEEMQQVDYSKLVPILVQAIQELNEKINKLENK